VDESTTVAIGSASLPAGSSGAKTIRDGAVNGVVERTLDSDVEDAAGDFGTAVLDGTADAALRLLVSPGAACADAGRGGEFCGSGVFFGGGIPRSADSSLLSIFIWHPRLTLRSAPKAHTQDVEKEQRSANRASIIQCRNQEISRIFESNLRHAPAGRRAVTSGASLVGVSSDVSTAPANETECQLVDSGHDTLTARFRFRRPNIDTQSEPGAFFLRARRTGSPVKHGGGADRGNSERLRAFKRTFDSSEAGKFTLFNFCSYLRGFQYCRFGINLLFFGSRNAITVCPIRWQGGVPAALTEGDVGHVQETRRHLEIDATEPKNKMSREPERDRASEVALKTCSREVKTGGPLADCPYQAPSFEGGAAGGRHQLWATLSHRGIND
jgi:hypothetical protein